MNELGITSGGEMYSGVMSLNSFEAYRALPVTSTVRAGTSSWNAVIKGGDNNVYALYVYGSAYGAAVYSGGTVFVYHGAGYTSGTRIYNGGRELVSGSAVASGTKIYSGGRQEVTGAARSYNAVVYNGGLQLVTEFGSNVFGTTISSGGVQSIFLGCSVSGTIICSGGYQWLTGSGSAVNTVISDGGLQSCLGSAIGNIISSGGSQIVKNYACSSIVHGVQILSSGCNSYVVTISSGGQVIVNAQAFVSQTVISEGGLETISANASAIGTYISYGGLQYCFGYASYTTIGSGGTQYAFGTTVSTTIHSGGTQIVNGGATSSIVSGTLIMSGGTASGTILSSGGQMIVSAGVAIDVNCRAGGQLIISSGGTVRGNTYIYLGTSATTTPIISGGAYLLGTVVTNAPEVTGIYTIADGLSPALLQLGSTITLSASYPTYTDSTVTGRELVYTLVRDTANNLTTLNVSGKYLYLYGQTSGDGYNLIAENCRVRYGLYGTADNVTVTGGVYAKISLINFSGYHNTCNIFGAGVNTVISGGIDMTVSGGDVYYGVITGGNYAVESSTLFVGGLN